MKKTSIALDPQVIHQISLLSKQRKLTFSETLRMLLDYAIADFTEEGYKGRIGQIIRAEMSQIKDEVVKSLTSESIVDETKRQGNRLAALTVQAWKYAAGSYRLVGYLMAEILPGKEKQFEKIEKRMKADLVSLFKKGSGDKEEPSDATKIKRDL